MTIKGASLAEAIKVPPTPFPGLRPFEFHESELFFGRDGQVEKMIAKLAETRFLAVVGTSGSGKSSLVRAGLLPALVSGMMASAGSKWRIAVMRPGNDPIGSLSRALNQPDVFGSDDPENAAIQIAVTEATLRRGSRGLVEAVRQNAMANNENLLVVVDQFEELFRFAREASRKAKEEGERYKNDAAAFVKLLLEAKSQTEVNIFVLLTMRSDFLGDCAQFWDLPEATNESQYLIPRLTRDQLREVITGPVHLSGAEITPRLVTQLLNDIGDDPDQLPVLQHLLMRVWDEWKEKRLEVEVAGGNTIVRRHKEVHEGAAIDLCCYEAVGGMAEALSRHADEAFNELPDDRSREVAEKLFKCLTEKGPDNREIRRPITLGEICPVVKATATEVITVVEAFRHPRKSFLMPPVGTALNAESLIDISHESLIRGWERLRKWVDEEARSARIYRRLAETAELHRKGEARLWADPDLQLALKWKMEDKPNKDWARRYHPDFETAIAFLQASEQKRADDIAEGIRRQDAEIERAKRDAEHAKALAVAEQQRAEAQRQKVAEQQRRLEDQAKATSRLRRLIALLVAAALLFLAAATFAGHLVSIGNQDREVLRILLADLQRAKERAESNERIAESRKQEADSAKQAAEGQRQNAIRQQKLAEQSAHLAEAQKQIAEDQKAEAEQAKAQAVQERIKVQKSEKNLRQLNYVANMNLAEKAFDEGNRARGYELLEDFLPDNAMAGWEYLRDFAWYSLWRLNHDESSTLRGHIRGIGSLAFSPDGKTLASASDDSNVKLWDVSAKREPDTLKAHGDSVFAVAFWPDSKTLATASYDGVILRDVNTKQVLSRLQAYDDPFFAVAFSPDGKTLASRSRKTVSLWDVSTKEKLGKLPDYFGSILAFSPDGKILAGDGRGSTLRLWDVGAQRELTPAPHFGDRLTFAFSPDGKTLAITSRGALRLWDVSTQREELITSPPNEICGRSEDLANAVVFSPDGKTVAAALDDGTLTLWDLITKKKLKTLKGHAERIVAVAFSPDGKTVATGSWDHTVKLWDVSTKQESGTFEGSGNYIPAVAVSRDGQTLASASDDRTVKLWDLSMKQKLGTLEGHRDLVFAVAFSPDGKTLASASDDATVKLWDLSTKQELGIFKGHGGSVDGVAFSPDGKTLASASRDETVKLWDVSTHQELRTLKGRFTRVAFSSDGKMLAGGDWDGIAKLWNISSQQEIGSQSHWGSVNGTALSPNGRTLATATRDGKIMLWDVSRKHELGTLKGLQGLVFGMTFLPDGKTLAIAGWRTVTLWSAATDAEVAAQRNK